ncbi:hypothetical protein FA13DRAFT_1797031 [Coprinellus micaceus]|uniref:Uncharacterized protein n=1 Tax=Coprinellus micaceus TaxID=71717 RepID=A0A4Y7SSG0_COPMI|nr:hypothetical protein FA13DRAFT_1797031 [Coprinellus micaceus]
MPFSPMTANPGFGYGDQSHGPHERLIVEVDAGRPSERQFRLTTSSGATLTYTGGGQVTGSLISPSSCSASVPQTTTSENISNPSISTLLECYGSMPASANYASNPEVRTKFS